MYACNIVDIPRSISSVLKSLVTPHTLLFTLKVHSVAFEAVGSWKLKQATTEVLMEGGQAPQSDVMMYSTEEQGGDSEVQLNITCPLLILTRLTACGGG